MKFKHLLILLIIVWLVIYLVFSIYHGTFDLFSLPQDKRISFIGAMIVIPINVILITIIFSVAVNDTNKQEEKQETNYENTNE